jgi:hypothetical protein
MGFWEAAVVLTTIGCSTGVVCMFIDKVFSGRDKSRLREAQQQLRLAEEKSRQQELRLVELNRQNDQLQKQLEWHGRLLETQEQALKRLESGDRDPAAVR